MPFGETIWCDDLKTLTVAHLGQPFVHVEAGVDTRELDTALNAQPFIATKCLQTTGGGICPSDLLTLNVAFHGQPFVQLQAYGIDTLELDTAFLGQPFIAQPYYETCEVIDPPASSSVIDGSYYGVGGFLGYPGVRRPEEERKPPLKEEEIEEEVEPMLASISLEDALLEVMPEARRRVRELVTSRARRLAAEMEDRRARERALRHYLQLLLEDEIILMAATI